MTLRNRKVRLEVGPAGGSGKAWEGLRIKGRVKHSRKQSSNEAQITVFNLRRESIDFIRQDDQVIRLLAGYEVPVQIFAGRLKDNGLTVEDKGAERQVQLDCLDGAVELKRTRLNFTATSGASVSSVVSQIADQMPVPVGRVDLPGRATLSQGATFTGTPEKALDRLSRIVGAEWWVQDRTLQFVASDGTTGERAAEFSAETGSLIGEPKPKKGDKLSWRGLLRPRVRPADIVSLDHDRYGGLWIARDVVFAVDTWTTNFYVDLTAKPR